jgi:hypothetical protein
MSPHFMTELAETYLTREADARAAATLETLENVREKHLLAAQAWAGLAYTARAMAAQRAKRLIQ